MKSPGVFFARWVGIATTTVGLAAKATPITYFWDDTALPGAAGVGQFTLDLPDTTADTGATGVSGAGAFLGSWQGAHFRVLPGFNSSLTISNLAGAAVTFSLPGDVATVSSSSAQEWQNFITFWTAERPA
jgi:hypothetical protein